MSRTWRLRSFRVASRYHVWPLISFLSRSVGPWNRSVLDHDEVLPVPIGTIPDYCLRIPIRFQKNHHPAVWRSIEPIGTGFESTSSMANEFRQFSEVFGFSWSVASRMVQDNGIAPLWEYFPVNIGLSRCVGDRLDGIWSVPPWFRLCKHMIWT